MPDQKDKFQAFITTVKENPQFGRPSPVIILSPLASRMLREYADQSNTSGKELDPWNKNARREL